MLSSCQATCPLQIYSLYAYYCGRSFFFSLSLLLSVWTADHGNTHVTRPSSDISGRDRPLLWHHQGSLFRAWLLNKKRLVPLITFDFSSAAGFWRDAGNSCVISFICARYRLFCKLCQQTPRVNCLSEWPPISLNRPFLFKLINDWNDCRLS